MSDQTTIADVEVDAEARLGFEAVGFAEDLVLSPITSVPGAAIDLLAPYRFVVDEPVCVSSWTRPANSRTEHRGR